MQAREKTTTEAFFANPKQLNIADKPPALGGVVKQITTEEFVKQTKMTAWLEGFKKPTTTHLELPFIPTTPPLYQPLSETDAQKLFNRMQINTNKLAICYVNDEVGYAVFANEDLPAQEPLSFYAGEIEAVPQIGMHTSAQHFVYSLDIEIPFQETTEQIQARNMGNISRFFPHVLPDEKSIAYLSPNEMNIDDYDFNGTFSKKNSAAENLEIKSFVYHGYPLDVFVTNEPVKKGEVLGFNYGSAYWLTQKTNPQLFSKQGTIVPSDCYHTEKVVVRVAAEDGKSFVIPKRPIADYQQHQLKIKVGNSANQFDFDKIADDVVEQWKKNPNTVYITVDGLRYVEQKKSCEEVPTTCSWAKAGFFSGKDPSAIIVAELNRITHLSTWKYDAKQKKAFLVLPEENTTIMDHLKAQGLNVGSGKERQKNNVIIFIHDPKAQILKNASEIVELKQHRF